MAPPPLQDPPPSTLDPTKSLATSYTLHSKAHSEAHAAVPSCSTRGLKHTATDTVWLADDETYNREKDRRRGFAGAVWRDAKLTTCVTTAAGSTRASAASFAVGPFTSTGGYDWWQGRIEARIDAEHSLPRSRSPHDDAHLAIGSFEFSMHAGQPPTDGPAPADTALGLPPLHNHHCTYLPDSRAVELNQNVDPLCESVACPGGYELRSKGFVQLAPPDVFHTDGVMNIWINDARPANSPPLTWYVQLAVGFVDDALVRDRAVQPLAEVMSQGLT